MSTPFRQTLPGVLAIVAGYALVHASTRLLASGNLGEDDVLDTVLAQSLAAGYSTKQGPLYDWAIWLIQQLFGTGLPGFLFLKYSLLVLMAGVLFATTRRLTHSSLWAFIAVESMASVYQIFWRFHEGFTHRVGAMALTTTAVWVLWRVAERQRPGDRLLFAVLLGLGLLSEHIVAFSLLAMLLAAALQPAMRRAVFRPAMLIGLPIAALIVAPYASWLTADSQRVGSLLANLHPGAPDYSLRSLGSSLRDALSFPIFVLAPYIVVLPLVFPKILRAIFRDTSLRVPANNSPDLKLFLTHFLLIELAGHLLYNALLWPRAGYPVHSILPMLVIAIAWLTEKARETAPSPKRVQVFVVVLLAFTITAYFMRVGNLYVYEPFCSRCRWGVPYADLAEQLRQRGFKEGTVITDDDHTAGNLRRFFPEARFALINGADAPQPASQPGPIAVIWSSSPDRQEIPPALRQQLPSNLALPAPETLHLPWHHLWKPSGYRHSTWSAIVSPVQR